MQKHLMDIQSSILFDKEEMLEKLVKSAMNVFDISEAEFYRDFVIEEYPVEIETGDWNYDFAGSQAVGISYSQQFKLRRKTEDEKQFEIETKKEKNVDS